MRILVLGGDGYLGWPTALHLSGLGHEVAVNDNFARRGYDEEMGVESLVPIATLEERIAVWREERCPDSRSSSRFRYPVAACCAARAAASAMGARPRLVCSTMPVALMTGRNFARSSRPNRSTTRPATASALI